MGELLVEKVWVVEEEVVLFGKKVFDVEEEIKWFWLCVSKVL